MISKIAWWVLVVLVGVVAWQAAKLTWLVWGGGASVIVIKSTGGATINAAPKPGNYVSWNLFGKLEKKPFEVKSMQQVNAPETKLRLELYGVVVATGESQSGAIIAERGKSAEYYRLEDDLPGNAKLAAVYQDHILLSRAGALEKLIFDNDVGVNTQVEQVKRPASNEPVDSPEAFMNVARQRLEDDPREALASVGLSPSDDEEGPSGYVFNGSNPMLAAMSMQKGDVIRSVNGHVLGNIEQDKQKLQELYESGMLEVEIERDGATVTINYPLR